MALVTEVEGGVAGVSVSMLGARMNPDDMDMDVLTQEVRRSDRERPSHVLKFETPQQAYGLLCEDRGALVDLASSLRTMGAQDDLSFS